VPKTPAGVRPPNVPFAVNTMGIRGGKIIKWLRVKTKRIDLRRFRLPTPIKQKIQVEARRLNAERNKVYARP
jgi:hypothetical protein